MATPLCHVSDLKPKDKIGIVELHIIAKAEPKTFISKWGRTIRVCEAIGEDDTGQIKVALWNDEIELVKVNDKIRITNGYVKEWQGELELTAGKYGKLEVIERSD
jgi:replication factor A1